MQYTKPYISIIVPVYNSGKYIARNLESLISQSLKNIEIICINDASTDNSLQILNDYRKEDNRIKIINITQNIRQGGARNRGIQEAKADYIMFVDSDDIIDKRMCEKLYNKVSTDTDIVICSVEKITSSNRCFLQRLPMNILDNEELKKICAFSFEPGPVAKLIRKEIITSNNLFFPEKIFYEDAAIVPAWILAAKELKYIHDPLYKYIVNSESTTQKKTMAHFDRIKAMEHLREVLDNNIYEKYKSYINNYIFKHGWINLLNNCISSVPEKPYSYIIKAKQKMSKLFDFKQQMKLYEYDRDLIPLHSKLLVLSYNKSDSLGNIVLYLMRVLHRSKQLIIKMNKARL